jgi:DNA-binding NarL/FixJ family response regulator
MKDLSVVMTTTEGSQAKVLEAVQLGAKGYVRKPFTADRIKENALACLKNPRVNNRSGSFVNYCSSDSPSVGGIDQPARPDRIEMGRRLNLAARPLGEQPMN